MCACQEVAADQEVVVVVVVTAPSGLEAGVEGLGEVAAGRPLRRAG